ncbi:trypsin-like serine protease [Actinacidiphila acididurans]|uniref:Trypsin-like serine protease n=1 Tax=Actinacidiphila acididurans TaxID=2784346 RepID=A0ABS2U0H2_9ACTN|nr:trypsin-like serine protease [Actinacidiphila acididurans]MBM9509103.1 trypsin-like serine protease [Actinacidiphila acididurans]
MTFIRKGGRRARLAVAAPLVALAVGAAGMTLTAPAQAQPGTVTGGTGGTNSTQTARAAAPATQARHQERARQIAAQLTAEGKAPAGRTSVMSGAAVTPYVIGGTDTPISSAPWMVQLLYVDGTTADFCGGTLVAQNKVLTAAHCVAGRDWRNENGVVVGGTATFGDPNQDVAFVSSQWVDPQFNKTTWANDVAILTLDYPFNLKTLPIATPSNNNLYAAGTSATMYGWGGTTTDGTGTYSDTLKSAPMPVADDTACASDMAFYHGPFDAQSMFCAGVKGTGSDATGKAKCDGDDGGPLVAGGKLIGLVSWGIHSSVAYCNVNGAYDVFARVAPFAGVLEPQIDNTDISRDGKADVIAKTPAGASYAYASTGTGVKARANAPVPFANYNTVIQADLERDGYQDYIMRATSSGNVFMGHRTADRPSYSYTEIGAGWKTVKAMLVPGDVTGDGIPDLVTEDSASRVWVYPGKGNGLFNTAVLTHANWAQYNLVVGHGDFSGDGIADVLARNAKTGTLTVLLGTGNVSTAFSSIGNVVNGNWNGYDKLVTVGDFSGDGKADLLARVPSGSFYLFKGNDTVSSSPFAASVRIGTGWNMYSLIG